MQSSNYSSHSRPYPRPVPLPPFRVYVDTWCCPDYRLDRRGGWRIVFPRPFSIQWWPSPIFWSDGEIVLVFPPPEEDRPKAVTRTLLSSLLTDFAMSLLGPHKSTHVEPSPPSQKRTRVTLLNLSAWSSACPGGYEAFARQTLEGVSPAVASELRQCVRFQTVWEYCARVGEDQVRLELGQKLCKKIGV
jgi:hypothetical protein